jgi:AcrR family transcriptional regulator
MTRRRAAPKQLTPQKIARAALKVADRDGFEAITMRRVGAELGVPTMTLYGYVPGKQGLLDLIVEQAVDEIELPTAEGDWRLRLKELLCEIRRVLARHPVGIRMRLDRPIISAAALRTLELALTILGRAGFSRRAAARGYRTLFLYTFGFAAFGDPRNAEETKRASRTVASSLPPDSFPAVRAAAAEIAETMAGDEQFEYGLDLLLDAMAATRTS